MVTTCSNQVILVLMAACSSLTFCTGEAQKMSFTAKPSLTREGDKVTLSCVAEGNLSTILQIKKDNAVLQNTTQGESSLTFTILSVKCDQMGVYECDGGQTEILTTEVNVVQCPLQPCTQDGLNIIVFGKVNETVNFTLCLLKYSAISEHILINNSSLKKNKEYSDWRWDSKESSSHKGQIEVTITRHGTAHGEFGPFNVQMLSSDGIKYSLSYNVSIQQPGADEPPCSSEVLVKDEGSHHLLLSWENGWNFSLTKPFKVLISKDNRTWYTRDINRNQSTVNISGLDENTEYFLMVMSGNVNNGWEEKICKNMILRKTSKMSSSMSPHQYISSTKTLVGTVNKEIKCDNGIQLLHIILIVIAILLFLLLLLVFIMCILRVRRFRQTRVEQAENQIHTSPQLSTLVEDPNSASGEYFSEEGLKYITVAHLQKGPKKERAKENSGRKVEYALLDFTRTGQFSFRKKNKNVHEGK